MFTCTLLGPVIAVLVAGLKKVPWIGPLVLRAPKVTAAVISAGLSIFAAVIGHADGSIQAIGRCFVEYFATAVATNEVAKSAGRRVGLVPPKVPPAVAATPAELERRRNPLMGS